MDAEKIQKKIKATTLGNFALKIFSRIYGVISVFHRKVYEWGICSRYSVRPRVVCIGNITAGGTGKTTAVMLAAKTLAEKGINTAIASRGYKRPLAKKHKLVALTGKNPQSWQMAGDEPFMLFNALKKHSIPVLVSADRVRAVKEASQYFNPAVILLDDGFSHHCLERDLDIILIDAKADFENNTLLPHGTLREPKKSLKHAGLILITHSDMAAKTRVKEIEEAIRQYNTGAPIFSTTHTPQYYFDAINSKALSLDEVKGEAVSVCAIGNPQTFEETLTNLGLSLKQKWRYPDHYPFTEQDFISINKIRGDTPVITTYKDFIRFPKQWREIFTKSVYVLSVEMSIVGGKEKMEEWTRILCAGVSPSD